MQQRRNQGGLTMIELMITLTILAVFMTFVFTNIMNTHRVSTLEDIRLDQDRAANGALREISAIVKDAFLPVRSFKNDETAKLINHATRGFGSISGAWERALVGGLNYFPFCQPIDLDGSGDLMDADGVPYFGVVHSGVQVNDAGYSAATWSLPATASVSPGLASLVPTNPRLADPQPPADAFSLTPGGAYGLVRFVPFVNPDTGVAVTVTEAAMNADFNNDNLIDPAYQYYVGDLEIYYPAVNVTIVGGADVNRSIPQTFRRLATMNMVLAPVPGQNTAVPVLPPIFTLVAMNPNGAGFMTYNATTPIANLRFDALRIQVTMLNWRDGDWRGDGRTRAGKYQMGVGGVVMANTYETVVRLRSQ